MVSLASLSSLGLVVKGVIFAVGLIAGRVKHPANLKLSAVKAEIVKIEAEVKAEEQKLVAEAKSAYTAVLTRIKSVL